MNASEPDCALIASVAAPGRVVPFPEPETLFSLAGVVLPRLPAPAVQAAPAVVAVYKMRGVTLTVYSAPPEEARRVAERDDDAAQFGLPLPRPVMAMIASNQIAFMNASLRSIFRSTRRQQNAMAHLMRQDILFCGDLTRLSRAELARRLERYRNLLPLIESELERLGLRLEAAAPWWERPRDYYCANY